MRLVPSSSFFLATKENALEVEIQDDFVIIENIV